MATPACRNDAKASELDDFEYFLKDLVTRETQKTRAGRRGYLLAKKTPARRQIGISQNSGAEGSDLLRNLQLQARPGIYAFVGIPSFTIVVTSNFLQRL
jgi:hypothetical protein